MRASARVADTIYIMKNNEYYVSNVNGVHGPYGPNGPIYWKLIEDLKAVQNVISKWPIGENVTKRESDSSPSRFEVIEKLAKIEAGVSHWEKMAKKIEDDRSDDEWHHRQNEREELELNLERAGRGVLLAQAILATNQDVLWAALCLLYINREKCALRLFEEYVDSVTAVPPTVRNCFAQLGFSDEESIRQAMKQGCP